MAGPSIIERIRKAFGANERQLAYFELALRVFPPEEYPRAWRYRVKGGPPGCYMALTRAINRMGLTVTHDGGQRTVFRPAER